PLGLLLALRSSFRISVNSTLSKTRRTAPRAYWAPWYPPCGLSGAVRPRECFWRARASWRHAGGSSWRPGEGPAAEHVRVDMRHGLARLLARVEDDTVTAIADTLRR